MVEIIHMVHNLHNLMFDFWFQGRKNEREKYMLKK